MTNSFTITGSGQNITNLDEWALHGLPESRRDLHWKEGRSALELGRSWTAQGFPAVPAQVRALLDSHGDIKGAQILSGFVEHETRLPFGSTGPRCHDLMTPAERDGKRIVICVEAKADEAFGGTLEDELHKARERAKKSRSGKTRFPERLDWLTRLLFGKSVFLGADARLIDPEMSGFFYQLLTAVGGTLIEASVQQASAAVLIFHQFRTFATEDKKMHSNTEALQSFLEAFLRANDVDKHLVTDSLLGPIQVAPAIWNIGIEMPKGIPLYIGKILTDRRTTA